MIVRMMTKETDLPEINAWLPFKAESKEFPIFTFCACKDGTIVSVGSLRVCEGDLAFIEAFASNPKFNSEDRHRALDMLVEKLIETAKENKLFKIVGYTKEDSIINRALRHGFQVIENNRLIVKEIN